MSKKLFLLISFVLVLGFAGSVSAQDPDYLDLWAEFLFEQPDPCADTSIHDHNIIFVGADATVGVAEGYNGTAYQGTASSTFVSYALFPTEAWPADGNVTFEMMVNFDTFEGIEEEARDSGPGWQYTTMMPLSMSGHYFQFESGAYDVNDPNIFWMNSNFWWEYNPDDSWEGYVAGPLPWETDRWYHWVVSMDNTNKVIRHWIDGVLVDEFQHLPDADFSNVDFGADFYLGSQTDEPAFPFQGRIDEVRFYGGWIDSPLPPGGPGAARGAASRPDPQHGEDYAPKDVTLSWKGGSWVANVNGHEVYFGTSWVDVNDADRFDVTGVYRGPEDVNSLPDPLDPNFVRYTYEVPEILDIGTNYYWRIDEVNESYVPGPNDPNVPPDYRWKGTVWNFRTEGMALNPYPGNGAQGIPIDAILSWTPGFDADTHDVYFGTDFDDVNDSNTTVYIGNQGANTLSPTLVPDVTYYWRIDEVNYVTVRGDIWSFTTSPFIVVDDMDSYANIAAIQDVWLDYWTINSAAEVSVETAIAEDGNSMGLLFDNTYKLTGNIYGSWTEASISDLVIGSDWNKIGAKALYLTFYGDPTNVVGPDDKMYVVLEDANTNDGISYYPDVNDVKIAQWQEWNIDLAQFAGVDFNHVSKISIGFGVYGGSPTPGIGEGEIYIDNILLWPARCVQAFVLGDIDGDCIVDGYDIEALALEWLDSDYDVLPQQPSDTGLLVEYLFEGNYNDTSGNNLHGEESPSGTGVSTGALSLDGVGYVKIPFGPTNPFGGSNDFSIAMSFRTIQPGMLISSSKEDPCDVTEAEYDHAMSVYPVDGPWLGEGVESGEVVVYENNFLSWTWSDPVDAVFDNEWHHVVVTYDADAELDGGLIEVYLDGDPPSQNIIVAPNIPNIDLDTVLIGDTYNPDIEVEGIVPFVGQIDDVRIYDYPLSLANVLWLAGHSSNVYFPLESTSNLLPKLPPPATYDPNDPDVVNFRDYSIIADHWLEGAGTEGPVLWP